MPPPSKASGQSNNNRMKNQFGALITLLSVLAVVRASDAAPSANRAPYFGSLIGKLQYKDHNVSGDVYAVDEQTLFIRNFNYDGRAPDAYFWSSVSSPQPSANDAFIVPDEKGSTKPLEHYQDKDIVLRLPEGKTLREILWLSVWSRQTKQNSGHIIIPRNLLIPRPLEIAPFSSLAHGLKSAPITIVDAQTFLVPDFHYDGLGPEAYFWLTRGKNGLAANGLRLKDENGSPNPLRKYQGETVVISLPDEMTIYDFDYFGVWCKKFQKNFGQTIIPQEAKLPPSPKMLGIKPENKLNCEILYDDLGYEIRWVLDGDDIVMQLVGKIEPGEYMAFGLGKDDSKSDMHNADVVVAWVDRDTGQVHATDYFLGSKQQCVNSPQGSCPDAKMPGGGDSLTLLHGAIVNGYSMVTFKRPQLGVDELYDQHVYSDGQQSVLWAIGSLNEHKELGYHRLKTRSNMFIDFARNPQWNCPIPDLNASMHTGNNLPISSASQLDQTVVASSRENSLSSDEPEQGPPVSSRQSPGSGNQHQVSKPEEKQVDTLARVQTSPPPPPPPRQQQQKSDNRTQAWFIPSIVCPNERIFYAQIGPTGGLKGYEGLTGRANWGVSWYVNGLMIPELVVERGQSYKFVVEGGNDKTSAARRHPFYLTDNPEGGFDFKTDDERLKERIFAGVALRADGQFVPTAEGRMCEWRQTNSTLANPDLYPTFSAYQRSLKLECQPGQASMLKFVPDTSTPDTIYYQCYTHRYMGWRIRVVNSCSAYLSSLTGSQRASNNPGIFGLGSLINTFQWSRVQNIKRHLVSQRSLLTEPDYDRRSFAGEEALRASSSELSSSFEHEMPYGMEITDFNNEPSGSFINSDLAAFSNDMLILNNSQLEQKQPFNLTTLEQLIKLSALDVDFLEPVNPESPLESYAPNGVFTSPPPIPLQNYAINKEPNKIRQPNKSTTKPPKTLHSYMRRLASIYYPVQQQLSSMLASSSSPASSSVSLQNYTSSFLWPPASVRAPIAEHQSLPQVAPSSFSLSSLVPKSKIDLSKATLSKKFNKFRFKSARKYEPSQSRPSQPPTPTNQFNYDIFNNQLAQMEQRQKQLQSLQDSSKSSDTFNYLPMVADEQAIESMNQQILFGSLMNGQPYQQTSNHASYQNIYPTKQALRYMPTDPPALKRPPSQQQTYLDYLSLILNNASDISVQQTNQGASWPSQQQHHLQSYQERRPVGQSKSAIYITRLPNSSSQEYPFYLKSQKQVQNQPDQMKYAQWPQNAIQYPEPYGNGNQFQERRPSPTYNELLEYANQVSSLPSVSLTIHEGGQERGQIPAKHEVESLSGSGSGSHYDFRQQPTAVKSPEFDPTQGQSSTNEDSDHMLAIERFSKQSSERRPPSIVHPVTGEQISFVPYKDNSGSSKEEQQSSGSDQVASSTQFSPTTKPRYSSILIEKNIIGSSSEPTPVHENDIVEIVDSASNTNDLKRLNFSEQESPHKSRGELVVLVGDAEQAHNGSANLEYQQQVTNNVREPSITSTAGPQVPTYGMHTSTSSPGPSSSTSSSDQSSPALLQSTLVEPLTSTLVGGSANSQHFMSRINFDSGSFTPIELVGQHYLPGGQPSMISSLLRPSALVESMMSQRQSPLRPEPPVQVASYLAHHLAGHNPTFISSEKLVASNQPMALSLSVPSPPMDSGNSSMVSNELIILKPTLLTKQQPQTFQLKPEYMTNQYKMNTFQFISPSSGESHHQSNDITEPSRRLAGHQFDRLSSLSSPPSTSITLDPMQTANTVTSYVKHNNQMTNMSSQASRQHISSGLLLEQIEHKQLSNSQIGSPNEDPAHVTEASGIIDKQLAQHRHTATPSKQPIPLLNFERPPSDTDGSRPNPGGDNSNTISRDNSTDNAILSHVMSLISAHTAPTPPIIPITGFSNADYFLPANDQINRSLRGW